MIRNPICSLVLTACLFFGVLSSAWALPLTSKDITQLIQQSPTLEEFSGEQAVIWRRELVYALQPDGTMMRRTGLVILASDKMPTGWLEQAMAQPRGGRVEVEQATIFNPLNPEQQENIAVTAPATGAVNLKIPQATGERIIVLSYRQYFPEPQKLEGMVWLGDRYAIWEGSIRVRLTADQQLYYQSSNRKEPAITSDEAPYQWLEWFYSNEPAHRGSEGMIDNADAFLLFSIEQGLHDVMRVATVWNEASWGKAPAGWNITVKTPREEIVKVLDRLWLSPQHVDSNESYRFAASASDRLTDGEMMSAMASWLRASGFTAKLWWQSVTPLTKEMPDAPSALFRPALAISVPGAKSPWYYMPLVTDTSSSIPSAMEGRTLYNVTESQKVLKRTFSAGRTAKNRLTAQWELSLTQDGLLTGRLNLLIRKAWMPLFSSLLSSLSEQDGLKAQASFVLEGLNDWYNGEEVQVTHLKDGGISLSFPLSRQVGILADRGMMLNLPSISPRAFNALGRIDGQFAMKFPFVLEQNYSVKIPRTLKPLALPSTMNQGGHIASYESQQRFNPVKDVLTGTEKFVVSQTGIDANTVAAFKNLHRLWGQWSMVSLALVRR